MNRWTSFRHWINRDDGKLYRAGNRNLHPLETAGYVLMIMAALSYLLVTKAGMDIAWFGWCFLATGLVLAFFGAFKGVASE